MNKKQIVDEVLFHLKDFRPTVKRRVEKHYENLTKKNTYQEADDIVWEIYDLISNR